MISSRLLESVSGISYAFGIKAEEGPRPANLVTARQIHKTEILFVDEMPNAEKRPQGFDILMTDRAGIAVGVKTADCLPILMVEPVRRIVAAVHAGWRGTLARVVQKTVERIQSLGGAPENLTIALGPCIGGGCYEVEEDVASLFNQEFPNDLSSIRRKSDTKWLLDLTEANRRQLAESGVPPDRIDLIKLCTHCQPDLFHSYRRDGSKAGRMVSFIEIDDSKRVDDSPIRL